MKASFSLLLLSSLVLFSCKKEEETSATNERTNVVPFTQMAAAPATTTPPATSTNTAYVGKEEKKESVMYQYKYTMVKNPNAVTTTTKIVTPPGMNPPHGQPKHRCDITVGAPLSSPVAKTASAPKTTAVSTPTVTSTTNSVPSLLATTPEATTTAEGMNPPHGQPKHRCDIAVGAPLPKE
nr:hypothetical protein [uncultured Flavobacterium sp.]